MCSVTDDMDMEDCPLMGAHGYCSQEMVHLCLIGKATSNTFDNDKVLDQMTVLKGIEKRSDIGLLSLFEHYDSIVVGDNLKTPKFPIWLVCAESHFTVLFGLQLGCERASMADRKPIDLFYYDQLSKVQVRIPKVFLDTFFSPVFRRKMKYVIFLLFKKCVFFDDSKSHFRRRSLYC